MKKILVLGAGMVSRPMIQYLLDQPDYHVIMASRTVSKAEQMIHGHPHGEAHALDVNDDYPDYAYAVARAVASCKAERGILVCGSGVGASIAANKVPGIRACLCHDTYSAHQGVEHDDMNILCLGARVIGLELACEIATAFLNAQFSGKDRHLRRLNKLLAIEQREEDKHTY